MDDENHFTASLSISQSQWQGAAQLLAGLRKGVPTTAARAINRTLVTGRKLVDQEIRKDYTIKSSVLKRQMLIDKAAPRFNRLSGALTVSGFTSEVYKYFQVKPKTVFNELKRKPRLGVQANAKRSTGFQTIRHSFVARMDSGHVGVFVRAGEKKRRPVYRRARNKRSGATYEYRTFEKREVIKEKFGPSPAAMLKNVAVWPRIERQMNELLASRFDHEVTNLLRQAGRI